MEPVRVTQPTQQREGAPEASQGKSRLRLPRRKVRQPDPASVNPPETESPRREKRVKPARARVKGESRAVKRASRVAALRERASKVRHAATGRHYARVGFASKSRRTLAYFLLTCVMACVAWMSWAGEHDWAKRHLRWHDPEALLVPGSLDIAGMYCALRGLDLIDKGENGLGHRIMAAVFIGMGAWINWRNELATGDITREAFFPVMTIMAYLIIHTEMSAARREARRRQHGETSRERPKPLPRFGALAWVPGLGDPRMAFDAIREAVRDRLARALAAASFADSAGDGETHGDDDGDDRRDEETHDDDDAPPDLTQMAQGDAIRWVLVNVSSHPFDATKYLREHGYPALASARVTDAIRRERKRQAATQGDAPESQGAPEESAGESPAVAGAS